MKRLLWASTLLLLVGAPVLAETIYYAPQVTGRRERKNIRHYLYVRNLTGDKLAVYEDRGYTAHRVRLNEYGQVRERWTYYEDGIVFTFDQCGSLVDTESITPESRRLWQYQRDVVGYDENLPCDD